MPSLAVRGARSDQGRRPRRAQSRGRRLHADEEVVSRRAVTDSRASIHPRRRPKSKRPLAEPTSGATPCWLEMPSAPVRSTRRATLDFLRFARDLAVDILCPHVKLVVENALLRQQLIVAERKIVGRPRWKPWERHAMAPATRFAPAWRTVTMLVQPATVLRWHRIGLRGLWRRRSRRLGRRPTPVRL